ncbi:MAG: DUF4139 domain-containing protein [Spirochaetes bacterium]|nr:DUF4139 domain-containing protein [Spirochaetota bacterium]
MKKYLIFPALLIALNIFAADEETSSKIVSVKSYQNQSLIFRETEVELKKGENTVVLTSLPEGLFDWSVKSSLPKNFEGKIVTVSVEQKMLVERFQKKVQDIEDKLKELARQDQQYIDDLASLKTQEDFVGSVLNFTNVNASKELQTRIPQVKVWDDTLTYCVSKKKEIAARRRQIETAREELGKEIQKWEFELIQIAGDNYYSNYQLLNSARNKNVQNMMVQQYADSNVYYSRTKSILKNPTQGTDIEKRIVLTVFSARAAKAKIEFSYMIPNTSWSMMYDIRGSRDNGKVDLTVYGNVYQKTGEDWKDVKLFLSTGAPSNNIVSPYFNPWYLDIVAERDYEEDSDYVSAKSVKKAERPAKEPLEIHGGGRIGFADIPQTSIRETGAFMEIELPLTQSILSSDKEQKKLIKDYSFSAGKSLGLNFELYLWQSREAFITAEITNSTEIPWLPGEAQIFLENEYMGKMNLPYIPSGKKETVVLGAEPRIAAVKTLVKKYEDTKGVFGGKRRIVYSYKIEVENNMKMQNKIILRDRIPVSLNQKITVEIKNASLEPSAKEPVDETVYSQGQRKYVLDLKPGEKKSITYEAVVSFDKELNVSGLE